MWQEIEQFIKFYDLAHKWLNNYGKKLSYLSNLNAHNLRKKRLSTLHTIVDRIQCRKLSENEWMQAGYAVRNDFYFFTCEHYLPLTPGNCHSAFGTSEIIPIQQIVKKWRIQSYGQVKIFIAVGTGGYLTVFVPRCWRYDSLTQGF